MWYKYSQEDIVLDSLERYKELGEREIHEAIKDYGSEPESLVSVPKKNWYELNSPYVKDTLRIHWFDPETRLIVPRKIWYADNDKIVLAPMLSYGSQNITHEDEALVNQDAVLEIEDKYGFFILSEPTEEDDDDY